MTDRVIPWVPCPCCEEYWCNLHDCHACDCDCPEVDDWPISPYEEQEDPDADQT